MPRAGTRRTLSTVLFTDIVGSTEIAEEMGDRRWREVLSRHHRLVRERLRQFGGREVDTAGDGVFATFQAPADAIRCACAISDGVRDLGIEIRAGLHIGETEVMGDKLGGIAVHTGARVASVAGPGEVLVTWNLKELVAGSGLEFEDRGEHKLKGVQGEWRLWNVHAVDGQPRQPPIAPAEASNRRDQIVPPPMLRRRPVVVGAVAAIVLIGAAAGYLLGREEPPPPAAPLPLDVVLQVDPETGNVLSTTKLSGIPQALAVGEGSVWVIVNELDVAWLDPQSGAIEGSGAVREAIPRNQSGVTVEYGVSDLAVGRRAVWVVTERIPGGPLPIILVDIDPATGEAAPRELGPGGPSGRVAALGDVVWVTSTAGTAFRLEGIRGKPRSVSLPGTGDDVAAGEGAVWITDKFEGQVLRLDPRSGRVESTIDVPGELDGIAAGEGYVWVFSSTGTVVPIDPRTNRIGSQGPISVGARLQDIAVGLGYVWLANYDGKRVFRVDPVSGRVKPIDIGRPVAFVAVDEQQGTLWLSVPRCPLFHVFAGCR